MRSDRTAIPAITVTMNGKTRTQMTLLRNAIKVSAVENNDL